MKNEWLENLIVISYKVLDTGVLLNIFSYHMPGFIKSASGIIRSQTIKG